MAKTHRDKKQAKEEFDPKVTSYTEYMDEYWNSHKCTYKKYLKRRRRAAAKQALREGKQPPRFKKSDDSTYWNDWL